MREFLKKRQERKQKIVSLVKADQQRSKKRKAEIATLAPEEQQIARKQDKIQAKFKKNELKVQLKQMDRKERKSFKKAAKIYRKVNHRRGRTIGWALFLSLILIIAVQVGPTVSNFVNVLTAKDITMDSSTPEALAAMQYGDQISEEVANEGIVLLKNDNNNLPLDNRKVNIFGTSSHSLRYGGGGSGASDISRAVNFYEGLSAAGIEYNESLFNLYQDLAGIETKESTGIIQVLKALAGGGITDEPDIDYLTDDIITEAKAYSDDAFIMISSAGTEASDFTVDQLMLTENKRALIEKVAENFENVTIIVNAGNTIDLGFIEEYSSIKSAIWIGTPGPYGATSLGKILTGEMNPSGRLTDTYAYDVASSPASVNFGDYQYDNYDKAFINYQEGIYVGYRFYESFYEGNEAAYQQAVQYPFGYGLSYTNFNWEVTAKNFDLDGIELTVKVTNTGDFAGKDVVQLYYSAPYIEGGLEKSAIELGAYAKTEELKPGESEEVTLHFATRDMASYGTGEEAYIMDEGIYQIKLAKNVHEIVDTFDFSIDNTIVIKENDKTGVAYENRFTDAAGGLKYLSRSDWEGTFPNDSTISHTAPQSLLDAVNRVDIPENLTMPTFNADNGLKLVDMQGLAYDDPKWDAFLDQFTAEEFKKLVTHGAYKTIGIERLGVPQTLLMDGPAGYSYFFGSFNAASYASEIVVASTWNDELAYRMGEAAGKEARTYGIQGWYAPAMNIHRTAQGGRNFEYFSEDPLISGKMSAAITRGAQDQGIIVFMKHFAMNDQETNARGGIHIWADEQAIREIYLRPFEITVKEANVLGAMSSFSYIGEKWAGANPNLLQGILRDEWGFEGLVSSDAVFGFMKAKDAIVAGNDLMLDVLGPISSKKGLDKAYKENPEWIAHGLRNSAHNIFYTILKTDIHE